MSQNVSASTEKPKAAPYQPLYAERGIRSSMLEGWKLFALHAADFLKAIGWQSLLAVSLGMAAVAFLVLPYLTECLAPWHVYTKIGTPGTAGLLLPSLPALLCLVGALLIAAACYGIQSAARARLLRHYAEHATLAHISTHFFRAPMKTMKAWGAMLVFDLPSFFFMLLLAGGIAWLSAKFSWWIMLFLPILLFLLHTLQSVARLHYVLGHAATPIAAWRKVFDKGGNHVGGYYIVRLLTYMPMSLAALACFLPFATVAATGYYASVSFLQSDPAALPGTFYLLSALALIISAALWSVCSFVLSLPMAVYVAGKEVESRPNLDALS